VRMKKPFLFLVERTFDWSLEKLRESYLIGLLGLQID